MSFLQYCSMVEESRLCLSEELSKVVEWLPFSLTYLVELKMKLILYHSEQNMMSPL